MERVEDEVVSIVGPPMAGDDFSATADHNLVYISADQNVPMTVGHRDRIVIGPVSDQGQRTGVTQYYWTDDGDVDNLAGTWIYLAGVVMHEFGHTWGLWHAPGTTTIMGSWNNAALPTSNDVEAMHAANDGHTHP